MNHHGKSICGVLKTIRKQVADANAIPYNVTECGFKGECRGTCPACEAEVRYIEHQLDLRKAAGKAIVLAGISAGLLAFTPCDSKAQTVQQKTKNPDVTRTKGMVPMRLDDLTDTSSSKCDSTDTLQTKKKQTGKSEKTAAFQAPIVKEDTLMVPKSVEVNAMVLNDKLFGLVEEMPSFPGGPAALMAFIANNIRYPQVVHGDGLQGRVVVGFIIEKDGRITHAKVMRSVDPSLDKEALRLIQSMPKWIPGKQDGRLVRTRYYVPVSFKRQ